MVKVIARSISLLVITAFSVCASAVEPTSPYVQGYVAPITTSKQIVSTVPTGTAPLSVVSTTPVPNLNIGGNAATATSSGSSTAATNLSAGSANQIPYQTGAGATSFFSASNYGVQIYGSSGVPTSIAGAAGVLQGSTSSNPVFTLTPTLTGTNFSGIPYSAMTGTVPTWNQNTTGNAANVTGVVALANGGTGCSSASGTCLDTITGFSGTGFITRTGSGTYAFQSTTNGITLANIAQSATNTVLANATSGTANNVAFSMPSCSTAGSALTWTTNTGFTCNTSITANTSGTATSATTAGTVTTAAQPSITSLGTLTSLGVTTSGSVHTIVATDTGANGANIELIGNGSTTPNKTMRSQSGSFQIINSAYGAAILTLTDAGALTTTSYGGAVAATTLSSSSSSVNFTGIGTGTSALDFLCWNASTGLVTADSGGTCLVSLEEYKNNLGAIKPDEALNEIMLLKPFWGRFKDSQVGTSDHRIQPFLGAHQVESIDPRLAAYDANGDLHGVRYMSLTAVLTAAMQKQQDEIEQLKAAIEYLCIALGSAILATIGVFFKRDTQS